MPLEFRTELLGEFAERQAAQKRLFVFAIAAAIGVFLLQASFASWRLAVLSFLTLPIALVGGVLAAYLGGGVLSLGSLVGFLTVLGIVARNGIMLIIPLIAAGQIPSSEIEHPMAIVILGGLITTTLLNLFVVPVLYLHFAKGGRRPSSGAGIPVNS